MRGFKTISCTILSLLLLAPAYGQYYRWTDTDGNPVVSDRPPPAPGTSYEMVNVNSGVATPSRQPAAGTGSDDRAPTPAESDDGDSATGGQSAAGEQESSETLCARARANLETLNTSARVRKQGSDGDIRYLSEEEKEAEREKARQYIARKCGGAG